jgi:hypothetical protein
VSCDASSTLLFTENTFLKAGDLEDFVESFLVVGQRQLSVELPNLSKPADEHAKFSRVEEADVSQVQDDVILTVSHECAQAVA